MTTTSSSKKIIRAESPFIELATTPTKASFFVPNLDAGQLKQPPPVLLFAEPIPALGNFADGPPIDEEGEEEENQPQSAFDQDDLQCGDFDVNNANHDEEEEISDHADYEDANEEVEDSVPGDFFPTRIVSAADPENMYNTSLYSQNAEDAVKEYEENEDEQEEEPDYGDGDENEDDRDLYRYQSAVSETGMLLSKQASRAGLQRKATLGHRDQEVIKFVRPPSSFQFRGDTKAASPSRKTDEYRRIASVSRQGLG